MDIKLNYFEIIGLCCFQKNIRIDFEHDYEILYGASNSGKTSFLKCLTFLLDDSKEYGTILNDDVLIAGAEMSLCLIIKGKKVYKRKVFPKKGSNKFNVIFENTNHEEMLAINNINVILFSSERFYSRKEVEYKRYELNIQEMIYDQLLDLVNQFESKTKKLLEDNSDINNVLFCEFKWDKLLDIRITEKERRLSTSERKAMLWQILLKGVNRHTVLLIDDIDVFWTPNHIIELLYDVEKRSLATISTVRMPYFFCTGFVDKLFQNKYELVEYVRNSINYNSKTFLI